MMLCELRLIPCCQVVLSQFNELDPTHYLDPIERVVFALNHMTLVSDILTIALLRDLIIC